MVNCRVALLWSVLFLSAATFAGEALGPYPKAVAAWDEAVKQKQREAGEKVINAINAAIEKGQAALSIPKGDYRFSLSNSKRGAHILIKGAKNLVIDANGSTFWCENQATAIQVSGCNDFSLKNLFIDYDPLPFSQGTVVGIDKAKNCLEVKIDSGYERVSEEFRTIAKRSGSNLRGFIVDRQTGRIKAEQKGFSIEPFWGKKLENGNYLVKVAGFYGVKVDNLGVEEGDAIVLLLRKGRAIKTEGGSNVTYENIVLYASGFVCYVEAAGKGPNVYRNCAILRRPETNRLIGGNADGFNSARMETGPTLDGCRIENIGDDFVNVHGAYYRVLWQESPDTVIVERIGWRDTLKNDLDLVFIAIDGYSLLGMRKGLKSQVINWKIEEGKNLADFSKKWAAGSKNPDYGKTVRAHRIWLDKPLTLTAATIISCENYVGQGSVIRNCHFTGSIACGLRWQSYNSVIEKNRIENTAGPALRISGQPGFWGEATNGHDIRVIDNELLDSCIFMSNGIKSAISVMTPGNLEKAQLQYNLQITGNKVIGTRNVGLYLNGVKDVVIRDNTIENFGLAEIIGAGAEKKSPAILLESAESVDISGNKIAKPGPWGKVQVDGEGGL